ncbi:hypothetical protein ABPG77_001948 [Micractinium sp. CCAP 211/92]
MLMKATFLATLVAAMPLLTAALLVPAAANWRPCDDGGMIIDGTSAHPVPARAGDEIVFYINGTLDHEVAAGQLEVRVDYLGFKVYSKTGSLCEAVPCPLREGAQRLELRQQLPRAAPPVRRRLRGSGPGGWTLLGPAVRCLALATTGQTRGMKLHCSVPTD